MRILARLTGFVSRHRARRARIRTAMLAAELPLDLQKDIGWPDGAIIARNRRETGLSVTETPQC